MSRRTRYLAVVIGHGHKAVREREEAVHRYDSCSMSSSSFRTSASAPYSL
jgi:hypothetical protein